MGFHLDGASNSEELNWVGFWHPGGCIDSRGCVEFYAVLCGAVPRLIFYRLWW